MANRRRTPQGKSVLHSVQFTPFRNRTCSQSMAECIDRPESSRGNYRQARCGRGITRVLDRRSISGTTQFLPLGYQYQLVSLSCFETLITCKLLQITRLISGSLSARRLRTVHICYADNVLPWPTGQHCCQPAVLGAVNNFDCCQPAVFEAVNIFDCCQPAVLGAVNIFDCCQLAAFGL